MCLQLLEANRSVLTTKEEMDFWQQITTDMSDEKDDTVEGEAGWIVRPPSFHSQELSNLCRRLQVGSFFDRCDNHIFCTILL